MMSEPPVFINFLRPGSTVGERAALSRRRSRVQVPSWLQRFWCCRLKRHPQSELFLLSSSVGTSEGLEIVRLRVRSLPKPLEQLIHDLQPTSYLTCTLILMRILHVVPHLSKGGAEKVVVELANAMAAKGHQVNMLLGHQVDPELNQKNLNGSINVRFVGLAPKFKFQTYARIFRLVKKNPKLFQDYEIIHCHLTYGFLIGIGLRFFGLRKQLSDLHLVFTDHSVGVKINPIKRSVFRLSPIFFDKVILVAVDDYWEKEIIRKKSSKIVFVPNGINTHATPLSRDESASNYSFEVGTISRLVPERNPILFLELVEKLNEKSVSTIRFKLGGDGPERALLNRASKKMGLESSVHFFGVVNDPNDFLSDVCVYVTLCVREISGMAGLEAVLAGVPIVGIQLDQTYETKNEDWIFSSTSIDRVSERISQLLSYPDLRATTVNDQTKYIFDNLTIQRMADSYLNVYSLNT